MNVDELTGIIGNLPDSEGMRAMLKWIEEGVTDIDDLRSRTADYPGGLLDQAAEGVMGRGEVRST